MLHAHSTAFLNPIFWEILSWHGRVASFPCKRHYRPALPCTPRSTLAHFSLALLPYCTHTHTDMYTVLTTPAHHHSQGSLPLPAVTIPTPFTPRLRACACSASLTRTIREQMVKTVQHERGHQLQAAATNQAWWRLAAPPGSGSASLMGRKRGEKCGKILVSTM